MNALLRFAAGFLQGVTLGVGALVLIRAAHSPGVGLLLFLGILGATIALHEAGHAFAAAAQGVRVLSLGIGPLVLERRRRGFRLHFRKPQLAGFVMTIPDFARDVRVQKLFVVAAGPAANLVAALILFLAAKTHSSPVVTLGTIALGVACAINAAFGIANLVPFRKGFRSDGAQLLYWWRNRELEGDDVQLLRLFDDSLKGRIASEYAPEEIAALVASSDPSLSTVASYVALRAAQQRHDREAFAATLARQKEKVEQWDAAMYARMRPLWAQFLAEDAFERARDGDVAAVDRFISEYGKFARPQRDRLDAARHLAVNDLDRASRSIDRARVENDGAYDAATRRSGAVLLAELSDDLDRRRRAA